MSRSDDEAVSRLHDSRPQCAGSSDWIERLPAKPEDAGSSPAQRTTFKEGCSVLVAPGTQHPDVPVRAGRDEAASLTVS